MSQPYPMGTFPKQFIGGGIARSIVQPTAAGGPYNQFTGGVVFAGGTLQSNKLFDNTFGSLNWPFQGIRNAYNDNKSVVMTEPGSGFGIMKAVAGGVFSSMVANQYVMLTFNSQLAGIATTVLRSPGSSYRKSQNSNIGWVDTVQINKWGGWYYNNGLPVNPLNSRDNIKTETYVGTYAIPGRLVFLSTGKLSTVQSYAAKSD